MPTIPLTGDPIVINIIVQLLSAGSSNALALGGVGSSGLGSTGLGSFAGFAFVAALAFALYARTYPMQDNYRTAA